MYTPTISPHQTCFSFSFKGANSRRKMITHLHSKEFVISTFWENLMYKYCLHSLPPVAHPLQWSCTKPWLCQVCVWGRERNGLDQGELNCYPPLTPCRPSRKACHLSSSSIFCLLVVCVFMLGGIVRVQQSMSMRLPHPIPSPSLFARLGAGIGV